MDSNCLSFLNMILSSWVKPFILGLQLSSFISSFHFQSYFVDNRSSIFSCLSKRHLIVSLFELIVFIESCCFKYFNFFLCLIVFLQHMAYIYQKYWSWVTALLCNGVCDRRSLADLWQEVRGNQEIIFRQVLHVCFLFLSMFFINL